MEKQKKCKINKYLSIKFEDDKSFIYIKRKRYGQCMRWALEMPEDDLSEKKQKPSHEEIIKSLDCIDETIKRNLQQKNLSGNRNQPYLSTREREFWGHVSNLQAWSDNNYDTRILHRVLSFPLLKALADAKDPVARRVIKGEIAKRVKSGYAPVMKYISKENYFNYFTREEIWGLLFSQRDAEILNKLENDLGLQFKLLNEFKLEKEYIDGFLVRDRKVIGLCLDNHDFSSILDVENKLKIIGKLESLEELHVRFFFDGFLESLDNLKNLKVLDLSKNNLSTFPEFITEFKSLEALDLSYNDLSTFPESLIRLKSLQRLDLSANLLAILSESIGHLSSLRSLNLAFNKLTSLPESIINLRELQSLSLDGNPLKHLTESITSFKTLEVLNVMGVQLSTFPKVICKLTSLKELRLFQNKLKSIPKSIEQLKSLQLLDLGHNKLSAIPESLGNLTSLKRLFLGENKLSTLPVSLMELKSLLLIDFDLQDTNRLDLRGKAVHGLMIENIYQNIFSFDKAIGKLLK